MNRRIIAILVLSAFLVSAFAVADEPATDTSSQSVEIIDSDEPFTLAQCIAIALSENQKLGAAREEYQRIRATVRQNYTYKRPRVTLQNVFTRVGELTSMSMPGAKESITLGEQELNISKIVFTQPVYTWGRVPLGIEMVKRMQNAGAHALSACETDIIFDLLKAYIAVLKSDNMLTIAYGTKALLKAHLELAETMHREGVTLKTDVLATRVRLLETERQVIESDHALQSSRQKLRNILALPDNYPVTLLKLELNTIPEFEISEAMSQVSDRPDVKQLKSIIEMHEMNYRIEQRGDSPTLSLLANWESGNQFNKNQKNWNANLIFEFPLFDGGMTRARADEARARLMGSRKSFEDICRQKKLDLQLSVQKCRELEEMKSVIEETLATARENHRLVMALLQEGAVLNTDALEAQLALNKALISHSNISLDLLLSYAEVFRNTGRLTGFFNFVSQPEETHHTMEADIK